MLFNGEEVGDGTGPECDVAVDPIDGTTLTAKGMNNAIAVLAVVAARHDVRPAAPCSTWTSWPPAPRRPTSSTSACPSKENIARVAKAKGLSIHDVTVVLLDRPRHARLVEDIRETGARIKYITDGDVAGAIMAARPDTGVDLMLGVGGTPEGIIAACAMKCIGGKIQGQLWPQDDDERQRALDAGHNLDADFVLGTDDLVTGDDCLLRGHRHHRRRADARRALPRRGRHDALAGDALAQRHGPVDHRRAPALEATRSLHDRLRQLTPRPAVAAPPTTAAMTCGSKAMPTCDERTSTARATGSTQARQSTMPSRLRVDRGEVDVGRQLGAGPGRSSRGRSARPRSPPPSGRACPARLSRTSRSTLRASDTWWAPGASIGLPMVTMPGDQVGAPGGDTAGEHAAEAVAHDLHARAATLGDLLEPLLELGRGGQRAADVGADVGAVGAEALPAERPAHQQQACRRRRGTRAPAAPGRRGGRTGREPYGVRRRAPLALTELHRIAPDLPRRSIPRAARRRPRLAEARRRQESGHCALGHNRRT